MDVNTNKHVEASLRQVTWMDIRDRVFAVNPELANIIDEIDPPDNFRLYLARYAYGSECLVKGQLHLANSKGELKPLSDTSISQQIRDDLSYNLGSNPVSLTLKNSFELFLSLPNRTIPMYGGISSGKILGTFRVLTTETPNHPQFIWGMTAGARSTFMLPKISEATSHQKLTKSLGVTLDKPRTLLDHWSIFKQIYQRNAKEHPWFSEILFFSFEWFNHLQDKKFRKFHHFILNSSWNGSEFYRNQYIWNLVFSLIQENQQIKPSAYISDTVKHILGIIAGGTPGFAPAIDETAAPIKLLQSAYLDIYKLKKYVPSIMQPILYSPTNNTPVYYSLNFPTAIEFAPKSNEKNSTIADLFAIRSLLNTYLNSILNEELNLHTTRLYENLKNSSFQCFHCDVSNYTMIHDNRNIPTIDKSFNSALVDGNNVDFPYKSPFISAVVRIMKKPDS